MAVKHKPQPNKPQPNKPLPKKPAPKKAVRVYKDWINLLTEKQTYLLLGSLFGLMLLIIFFDFIMGDRYYLFKDIGSDTVNFNYPNYVFISKYLHTDGFPKWSFSQGMGQNILPVSLADPLYLLLYFMGSAHLAYGIILTELIKITLGGLFFFQFLKLMKLSRTATIIGALLYAFSGFMIAGGSWYMFSTEAMYLALLLWAFERFVQQRSWYLFPVAIALIAIYQTFDVYLYGLFLITYILFRFLTDESFTLKRCFNITLQLAGLTALGLLISSFFLFVNIQTLLDSPRVGGNSTFFQKLMSKPMFAFADSIQYTTAIMRTFSNDMIGNGIGFKGWGNYLEAPLFYIGLLPLLLFTQVFSYLNKKRKIIYAIFLAFYIFLVIFPFLRNAFWAFTGDYYRGFSVFFSFVLLFFSVQVISELDKLKKINLIVLLLTFAGLLVMLYYPYQYIDQIINKDLQGFVTTFLIIYAIIILLFNFIDNRAVLKILLILVVCVELVYLNGKTVRDRNTITQTEWKQKTGYNDYTVESATFINSLDKGFYRVSKEYSSGPAIHSSINDAKVFGYYGTPCYYSFNQKYYIRFLEETGIIKKGIEDQSRWAQGLASRPLLQIVGNVKYHFTKESRSFYQQMGYDSIAQFGDVKVLKNRFFLPMGCTYSSYIPFGQFSKLSTTQKDFALLRAVVAEEPVTEEFKNFKEYALKDTSSNLTFNELAAFVNALKTDTLKITQFSNNHIKGTISLKEPKLLFFSIPYDKGWTAIVDGQKTSTILCNLGFTGIYLNKGEHQVQLDFELQHVTLSLSLSGAGVLVFILLLLLFNTNLFSTSFHKKKTVLQELPQAENHNN